jgi:transglutaminase-like putative cysteine protease
MAHVFVAAARYLGLPARYVGGYLFRGDEAVAHETGHAWAEAYVERLGWVGFDPSAKISVTDAYVRIAIGLDYYGAAPVRGTRYGGNGETAKVALHVDLARQQSQSQSQT